MGKTIVIKNRPNAFQLVVDDIKKTQKLAAVNTVNRVAFTARKNAISNIEKNFTLRNTFTTRNIIVTPAQKSARLDDIRAYTGATEKAEYMARQETGGTKRAPSGKNLIIPNTRACGGSNKNTVRKKFRYDNVIQIVATAFIAAREKIVEGAVSMVKLALDNLKAEGVVELDEERKAAMVSNLLVVLCAEDNAQPIVNAGTLYD